LEHRIGGLEKQDVTGNISYEPENHQLMVKIRQEKIDRIADYIPEQKIDNGPEKGELLVLDGVYLRGYQISGSGVGQKGHPVAHAHLRYVRPFPKNLGEILQNYKKVLIPEINNGQLIRSFVMFTSWMQKDTNKIMGVPITKTELVEEIKKYL